jgi:hypothetical protein
MHDGFNSGEPESYPEGIINSRLVMETPEIVVGHTNSSQVKGVDMGWQALKGPVGSSGWLPGQKTAGWQKPSQIPVSHRIFQLLQANRSGKPENLR